MKKLLPFFIASIALVSLGLPSCSKKDAAFESEYGRLHAERSGESLIDGLLALEASHPDEARIKLDLGALYLERGDLPKARAYLSRAKTLERRLTSEGRYALQADLAELELRSNSPEKALERASEALSLSKTDPLGVIYTKAKALAAMEKKTEALSAFDAGWKSLKDKATREDCRVYVGLLIDAGRLSEAVGLLDYYQEAFPYEFGIGILESQCYEKMGDIERSVIAACKELEYARSYGAVDIKQIEGNLAELQKKLADRSWNPKGLGRETLGALLSWEKGQNGAVALLSAAEARVPGDSFLSYARIGALLESGVPTAADMAAYLSLERHYKALPAYYAHLWRGARRLPGLNGVDPELVAVKCIDLAPSGPYAAPSRAELCRLASIPESNGPRMMTEREIGEALASAVGSRNGEAVDRLLALLDTPDNRYAAGCQAALREVKADPFLNERLGARLAGAGGRLKERLTYILAP
jgi:tetratricopeptide (TPR) repeat protein